MNEDYFSPGYEDVPDLRPHFRHLNWREMRHAPAGHLIASDFADLPLSTDPNKSGFYKNCGFWCRGEVGILWKFARQVALPDYTPVFLDIGAHTGWTSSYLADACQRGYAGVVLSVEPMFRGEASFEKRFHENTFPFREFIVPLGIRRDELTAEHINGYRFDGTIIDGDHGRPNPLEDAKYAAGLSEPDSFILLHDAWGEDVLEACDWLHEQGDWESRFYETPHGVAAFWRGSVEPPYYKPDPRVDWESKRRQSNLAKRPFND